MNWISTHELESIDSVSTKIWWKWANLLFLKWIESDGFIVPQFVTVSDFSEEKIKEIELLFSWKLVAVRSSGTQEDSKESSLAWSFRTELNVEPSQIWEAINRIHQHSIAKANEQIPIVIQEMVQSQNSWVIFTFDVDERKPYFVVNMWDWLWESLVSWEQTWQTYKILSWINPDLISNQRIRNLYRAVSLISSKYPTPYIDVEFGFIEENDTPYILQVRPIVWIIQNSYDEYAVKVSTKYARLVHQNLIRTWEIYGNMIDINPEELVWSQPEVVKSFFDNIFPKASLISARRYLWYGWWSPIMELPNYHPYVSLERDIRLFLPNNLPETTVLKIIQYYKDLLIQNPWIQNSLDALHYPNTIEQVTAILPKIEMSTKEIEDTISIFTAFFEKLEYKLFEFEKALNEKLLNIFSQLSTITWKDIADISDLLQINYWVIWKENILKLIELIKELTFIFTIVARGAFYFSNKDSEIDQNYFKSNKYEASIRNYMLIHWLERMNFELTDWFNFLSRVTSEYTIEWLWKLVDSEEAKQEINPTSRFMVYRENIKFIFSRLFLVLNYSIPEGFESGQFVDFNDFIRSLSKDDSDGIKSRRLHKLKTIVDDILIFPSVLHAWNSPVFLKLNDEDAHYIWNWVVTWNVLYVTSISELVWKDLSNTIVCIENATPEIDIFLPKIRWIITRNWWPLAHIAIRAREYKIPSVVWTGRLFDEAKNYKGIKIDFSKEKITPN